MIGSVSQSQSCFLSLLTKFSTCRDIYKLLILIEYTNTYSQIFLRKHFRSARSSLGHAVIMKIKEKENGNIL